MAEGSQHIHTTRFTVFTVRSPTFSLITRVLQTLRRTSSSSSSMQTRRPQVSERLVFSGVGFETSALSVVTTEVLRLSNFSLVTFPQASLSPYKVSSFIKLLPVCFTPPLQPRPVSLLSAQTAKADWSEDTVTCSENNAVVSVMLRPLLFVLNMKTRFHVPGWLQEETSRL